LRLRWPNAPLRWPRELVRWPNGLRGAIILALAAGLVLVVLAGLTSAAMSLYRSSMPRFGQGGDLAASPSVPTAVAALPAATPRPVLVQRAIVPTATPPPPTPTPLPRSTAVARLSTGSGAIGTQVSISDQNPPRGSDLGVTVRLTRDRRPLADVPVALRVYYETIEERWPPGDEMVLTNANGEATIAFNIGDAMPGYEAQVVALADVEGEPVQVQTSFVPR
ncbi:MAG: hypothetical protein M3O34_03335, partial [Chloroflexota bacterium]|nr:hypothetical protein [Chloroflexota bacterium]